jgi:oligoribonuclease NrnB/cAMP/cGMP phosphodiesterase (DHH superfamily)
MKPLVIYHANCTDGFGAAFAAWCKLGDDAEYLPMHYSDDPLKDITYEGRDVYILDFSVPREDMVRLLDRASKVVWLDHHASVMREWGEGAWPAGVELKTSSGVSVWVDPEDLPLVEKYSWNAHVRGGAVAYTGGGRAAPKNEYMHHLLLPQKDGFVVDHINRNTLDNRRCNLRYATRSENGANMDRGSKYKGVTPHGSGFKAQITVDGSNRVIGTFASEEEAARAYDIAAKAQWGVFARINFGQRDPFPPTAHVVLDNNKSGALLAWEYFHPEKDVPDLIKRIDDRDRWQFKFDDSKALHAGLNAQPFTFESWKLLTPLGTTAWASNYNDAVSRGRTILSVHNEQVRHSAKKATPCTIIPAIINSADSYKGPWLWSPSNQCYVAGLAVNTPNNISDVGHELANASGTFGLVWYYDGATGRANCSLRSNGDYDVSAVAKAFGGGGHKNAAGFNIDMPTLLGWLKRRSHHNPRRSPELILSSSSTSTQRPRCA